MALIESVQARHQGSQDFAGYYNQLCALQDTCPLTSVRAHLSEGALDLNADRIRLPDWAPILNTLRINKGLDFVGVRSYFQQSGQENIGKKSKTGRRAPPIRTKDVTYRLCVALKECLAVTSALTFLEIQGIPLRSKDVQAITKGIMKNSSLQHLSVEGCRVGDRGVELLTNGLKNSPSIASLNFSACGLTTKGAEFLAKLIKHQSTRRHSEAWKDSLRYRRPDLDRMAGIRRITLNANPIISDDGAFAFADALRDDLWLKALDLQQCGISNEGGKAFLDSLHENSTIVVLDIRKNHLIDRDLLKAVMEQVMINGGGQEMQYKWLHTSSPKQCSKPKRVRTKSINNSVNKKGSMRVNRSPSKNPSRSRSSGSALVKVLYESYQPHITRPGPGFVPWRTAARASQRSMAVPIDQVVCVDSSSGPSGSTTPIKSGATSVHVHAASSTPSSEQESSHKDTSASTSATMRSRDLEERDALERWKIKDMQVEIEELRRRMYIESRARAAADARVVELEVDNSRLKHLVQLLEARSPGSPLRGKPAVGETENGGFELNDDSVLDSIEESFQKFHGFLDLLREAGLGQLCNLVGLGPQHLKSPRVASILHSHQPFDQAGPSRTRSMGHLSSARTTSVHHTMDHVTNTYKPSDMFPQYTKAQSSTVIPTTIPAPSHTTDTVKQHERTMQHYIATNAAAETGTVHDPAMQGRDIERNTEPIRDGLSQELRIIHTKPLVSPPDFNGTFHTQSHLGTRVPIGLGGFTFSKGQTNIEASVVYQPATTIETQYHPPHSSLLPPTAGLHVTSVPAHTNGGERHISQGVAIPSTQPTTQPGSTHNMHVASTKSAEGVSTKTSLHPMLDSVPIDTQKLPYSLQSDTHIETGEDNPLKDILFSKQKHVTPDDSMSVNVGSVVSFTNPEPLQLKISKSANVGAGNGKHLNKPTVEGESDNKDQKNGSGQTLKETSKGSASEDDYKEDFIPSSDSGSSRTRNSSDRTSTPTKSSASHRTYTRSSVTGSDHSDNVKSFGSSISEGIGETPSPNQGDARPKLDDSSEQSF